MQALKIAAFVTVIALTHSEDDKKWVWGDGNRQLKAARYNGYSDAGVPGRPYQQNFADYNNNRPNYNNQPDFLPFQQGGGVYNTASRPVHENVYSPNYEYGQQDFESGPGILTGPVPSWVQEKPYKNYDRCKCTERFNCNSPGISYGHCDVGKQYCCYSTKKISQLGEDFPRQPIHDPSLGVLVGPSGPIGGRPFGHRPRPGGPRPGGFGLGPDGALVGPQFGRSTAN